MTTKMVKTKILDRFVNVLFVSFSAGFIVMVLLFIYFVLTYKAFSVSVDHLNLCVTLFIIGLIPNLLFSFLMEFVVKPMIRKNEVIVLIGSFIGFSPGLIIIVDRILWFPRTEVRGVAIPWIMGDHFALMITGGLFGYAMTRYFVHPESEQYELNPYSKSGEP